ncbi:polyribonucleotide nucleotidyltransferase [Helicobacter ibis]|uniref:Polyribonucleotide nucleotidyltransferase n=1 Tax=Helicobacter ibis TaxID=2962633 RepID=A0ABT4VF90_9HELI|nr:polyribonucleotide nucleotidyltransferase [Helicobacter ibis]MDA3969360.1 polyribonucleotide nucleotidyltransferase [Helicobacter ibis]
MNETIIGNESYVFNKFAKQASGSAYLKQGNNVLLATVTIDTQEIIEEDFLPLTVQYIEKSYAAGKFPGGYVKREAKPGDFETLTARIVDRSLRPLFPKDYCYPTNITILVLSADSEADLQILALNVASAALYVSEIPISKPVNGIRIGLIEDNFVVNPKTLNNSTLDLLVSGVDSDLLMIEMRTFGGSQNGKYTANELKEEELTRALELAKSEIEKKSNAIKEAFLPYKKQELFFEVFKKSFVCESIKTYIANHHSDELKGVIESLSKTERNLQLNLFIKKILNKWREENPKDIESLEERVSQSVMSLKRDIIRSMILDDRKRADGRALNEVRPISIETNFLPKTHSSVLFTRGQTQALVVATLGGDMDAQSYELLTSKGLKEKFMLHYNFPPFSVGEVGNIGAPGRRELGHGNLAKRALECSVETSPYTIRLVSEILESNGSSSMATVCGGSLALAAAGIPCSSLIAGVAMGLVCDGNRYAVLTDIMGLEDHDGDMDFKVAGSLNGITAMQMDIKLGGLNLNILKEALSQAKDGIKHILSIMEEAREKIVLNDGVLPRMDRIFINPNKIVEIIGQGGRTIKDIIERFGVNIDLNRDSGEVCVSGDNKEKINNAIEFIKEIALKESAPKINPEEEYKVGDKYQGKVKKIVEFGAFVELPKGYDGLLHVSKLKDKNQLLTLKEGDMLSVQILSINKNKVELSLED